MYLNHLLLYYCSEEELAGSYNWDYLLDWGPQYQPLAHVFKEISKLRDDEDDEGGGGIITGVNGSTTIRMAAQSNSSLMRYINIILISKRINIV